MTDGFVTTAREVAAINGLPEYPFVVIPHPIAGNSDDELHDKAERALAAVVSLLTTRGRPAVPRGQAPASRG
jgi:hypothetical protein